ncbi:MAG: HNH endonuclease [Beijerinckiaceae bacterium]|nr:HNH endonuclease [Beijerinckiaceae bacterium]
MTCRNDITAERLRKLLTYDPETGIFTWLPREGDGREVRRWNARYSGKIAGCINKTDGYRYIKIDGQMYLAHRVAVLYVKGEWPRADIDHINLDRADTRFCNLRQATRAQNMANIRKQRNNTGGYKGAY